MFNALRTTVLLAALTAIFMGVGYIIGGTNGMAMAFVVALVTNFIGYWNSDKLVLGMQNAVPVDPRTAPDLYHMVEDLSSRAGIPMPAIYLIQTEQPNAFATGRDPSHAAVAVSSGLLRDLEPREVAAVIAHELAHIRSRDTLTMTITATFAGAISMLAQFGLFFGGGNRDNPLGGVGTIIAVMVAPIAAMLVQMAVSRTREYEADKDGAEICGDPMALASALQKISSLAQRRVNVPAERNPAMAHLYIANPLSGARMDNLFSTHPDVQNRIAQLQALVGKVSSRPSVRPEPSPRRGTSSAMAGRVPEIGRTRAGSHRHDPWR